MSLNSPSTTRIIKPTDEELFQSFLYNKINNNPLPNHITIIELDLFGTKKNPWEIWEEFATSHSYCGRDLYFFSALKKKSATSSRSVRLIGKGTWEGEDTGTEIFTKDTNQLLGLRKRYRFEKSDTVHDNGWILHEYKLDASLITNPSAENYVLCRFRKNVKKNPVSTRNRIAKNSNRRLQRNNTSIGNTGRGRRRKKTVAECEATTISGNNNNNVVVREYTIYEEPINQSNGGHNSSNDGHNSSMVVKKEYEYKKGVEEEGVKNTCPNDIIVIALESSTDSGNENINQRPRSPIDSGNNKTEVVKTTKEEEVDSIMNKEEDDNLNMSWPEYFAMELKMINEGCLIQEEEYVPMLSNSFHKDLILECFNMY